jgi:protein gp37
MGTRTGIGWTEKTWNPWQGCTKVSAGCDLCYMFTEKTRYGQDPATVIRSKDLTFNSPRRWGTPSLIFTCSWSDFFHVTADPWRADAWKIIRDTPHHTYQILTKRPGRIARHLPPDWGDGYPNVWLGTSVENDEPHVMARIEQLLAVPAALHWLSCEPLIGPVSLRGPWHDYLEGWTTIGAPNDGHGPDPEQVATNRIRWVVAGGESGAGCRPCDEAWLRTLRDQCADTGAAYYLKQLGGHPNKHKDNEARLDGRTHVEFPADAR